jgi:hypothetical protein
MPRVSHPRRPAPSHPELLAVARAVRRAAVADDTERVHVELCRLRSDLLVHVHAEREELSSLPAAAGAVVAEGHRRLLGLLDDLLCLGDDGRAEGCGCLVRAAEVEVELRRQAMLEGLLRRHGTPAGTERG